MRKRLKRDVISPELRERVLKRDSYACRYCYSTNGPFHMDHVYPFSKGGETTYANLVTACSRCNVKKGAKVGVWPRPLKDIKIRRHRNWFVAKHAVPDVSQKGTWILEYPPLPPRTSWAREHIREVVLFSVVAFCSLPFLLISIFFHGFGNADMFWQYVGVISLTGPIYYLAIKNYSYVVIDEIKFFIKEERRIRNTRSATEGATK